MKRGGCIGVVLLMLLVSQTSNAQSRYLIKFKDKAFTSFSFSNPSSYLSARSIARRNRYNIAIDSTDLPVTSRYIDSLRAIPTVLVLNPSKWLNQVSIQITDVSSSNIAAVLNKINSFPFVRSSSYIALRTIASNTPSAKIEPVGMELLQRVAEVNADYYNYGQSQAQVHIHNGEFLHNIGLRGQGMQIGMLDGGFKNYLTVKAFDSARKNGQILGTWDFVAREESVNEDHEHGMECFSTIAANIPGQFVGTAPKASFYLFRSEDVSSEYPIEEHNWVCAAERVDSSGGDVISSSVGYTVFNDPSFNHAYAQLDGNTLMATIGADLAAKKGILVVQSAGNEGDKAWGKITTPADADSILTVGAVTATGVPAAFSSQGPTSDGQIKPDVASVGVAATVQLPTDLVGTNNGTSFSTPNMAGIATCIWQGFQEFNNMKIIDALRKAGSLASNPNNIIGYGIPDVKKAVLSLLKDYATANASISNCKTTISWNSKDMSAMRYDVERKAPGQNSFTKVGEVTGSGVIFSNQSRQFTDDLADVGTGAIIYRIRQVIDTSTAGFTADYISILTVDQTNTCLSGQNSVTIFPNPVHNNSLTVKVVTQTASSNIHIRVINSIGQTVSAFTYSKTIGVASFQIPTVHLSTGKYYVRVYDASSVIDTKEFIKL